MNVKKNFSGFQIYKEVGQLYVCYRHDTEITVEWKIKFFLSHYVGNHVGINSPAFLFGGTSWYISIFPSEVLHFQYVAIYIKTKSCEPASIIRAFSLYLKTNGGKADTYPKYIDNNVPQGTYPFGSRNFILLSELIERPELLPEETLTVICTLKKRGTHIEAAGNATNDEITKTREGTAGNATNDEITKTREGTDRLKLQQHFEEIFQNGNFSDVVLKVDNQEFKCHKCVLARSPVFSAMMTHEMKEKNTGVVDIQDDNPNTFYDFLHYLYTGNKEIIKSESVVNLFTAADKYQVDELKKSCLDYMLKNISVDNFCDVLSLSLIHLEKDLTDACSQFYIKNSLSIAITPKWLQFMIKHPVAANELNIKQLKSNMKIKN